MTISNSCQQQVKITNNLIRLIAYPFHYQTYVGLSLQTAETSFGHLCISLPNRKNRKTKLQKLIPQS